MEYEKLEDLRSIQCSLIECLKTQIETDMQGLDTHEAGEVIDMIKDLAETEKYCMEARYYEIMAEDAEKRRYRPQDEEIKK